MSDIWAHLAPAAIERQVWHWLIDETARTNEEAIGVLAELDIEHFTDPQIVAGLHVLRDMAARGRPLVWWDVCLEIKRRALVCDHLDPVEMLSATTAMLPAYRRILSQQHRRRAAKRLLQKADDTLTWHHDPDAVLARLLERLNE